jgi:membrane associated rhomboid family serine protease
MYVLYSFGSYIEKGYIIAEFGNTVGRIIFISLYLLNIILANIPTLIKNKNNPSFASIGASGAISGLIFISILLRPWDKIGLFFFIDIHAIFVGIIYLIYSSWEASKERGRIDHLAHFAGAIAGMVLIILLRKEILIEFFHKLVDDFPL